MEVAALSFYNKPVSLEHFSNTLWLKEHRDGDFLWDNVYNGMDYFGYMCIK